MKLDRRLTTFLVSTALAIVGSRSTFASSAARAQGSKPTEQEALALRQRWERMSPEEQVRMRRRFEELREMSKEERQELMLRAKRLREARARLEQEWPHDVRERMGRLSPEERRLFLDDFAREEAREIGKRVRERLPRDLVLRLKAMPPAKRAQAIARFKDAQRQRTARALHEMGRRLELPKKEIERIEHLPREERERAMMQLRKRLPAHGDPQRGASKPEVMRALREASRPHPGDFATDESLSMQQRREQIFGARRERCLAVLRESELVSPSDLADLEALQGPRFFQRMRELVPPLEPCRDP